ncbi:MAG: hypothetical protein HZC04_00705 [Candidatus Lloydbacteria bacterium]|nr:hypothetical protein [Candidatus Lloydbacteria bacterium]
MSPLSFSAHKPYTSVALLDIGSTSVGAALVRLSEQTDGAFPPTVVWSRRKEIPFQQAVDSDHFFQRISGALKAVLEAMSTEAKESPQAFFCTFSSPWYAAQTRIAKSTFPQSSIITPQIVNSLVDAEAAAFEAAYASHMPAESSGRAALLEQKIMRVRLNGYAVEKPYGKSAQEVDVALYISMSPQFFLDEVNRLVGEVFHRGIDQYHSLAFVSFSALRDIFPEREHFLMCDIGGEITDLSLVKNNLLVETVSFPKGRMTLMRDAVSRLKRQPEEVLSMLTLHFEGLRGEDALSPRLNEIIEQGRKEWLEAFYAAMTELRNRNFLAGDIEITAHPLMRQWIGSALSSATPPLGAVGNVKLNPHFIDAPFLRTFVSFQDAARQFDAFLGLEAVFAEKILNLAGKAV